MEPATADAGCPIGVRAQIEDVDDSCLNYLSADIAAADRLTEGSADAASVAPFDLTVDVAEAPHSGGAVEAKAVDGGLYQVGPGDQLQVLVWRQPELSASVTVGPDGRVSVPLVKDLLVAGQTPSMIARRIEGQLGQFVRDPLVNVVVSSVVGTFAQQVRVIGKAVTPSAIPFRDGLTILDVMVAVGGLSPFADGNGALIVRQNGDTSRQIPLRLDDLLDDGDATANVRMEPGDVVVIPEGFFSGDWRITPSASFSQEYSDNIDREPKGEEREALVTEIGPRYIVTVNTARISGALNSLTQARKQSLTDPSLEIRNELNATSTVELVEDFFFLDASGSTSRQTLDTSSTGSDADQEQVTSFIISPYLRNHFGSFADSELRLSMSQSLVGSGGVSDDSTTEASFFISSGRDFNKFLWSIDGSTSETSQSDDGEDITETQVTANLEYALSREFSLFSSLGFQVRDDSGTENDIDDPTWELGFNWRPSRRTDFRLSYGQRDGQESLRANLNYEIGPRSSVALSYSEELETPQERLQNDLAAIAIDPETGELIDSRDGGAFDPNTSPFSIDDETTRTRRLVVRYSHQLRRNSYNLSFQGEDQSTGGGSTTEKNFSLAASWARRLNPRTSLSVVGSLEHSEFVEDDTTDIDLEFSTSLAYQLLADVDGTLSYSHSRRFADTQADEFVENLFQLGLGVRF